MKLNNELYLIYRFCKSNGLATIGPGIFIIISYLLNNEFTFLMIIKFLIVILYNILYIYQFDILNQIKGIEEDRINKPDRPLVSGLININQATHKYIYTSIFYIIFSYLNNVFIYSFIWIFTTILYNLVELDKHWFFKSLLMFPAIYTLVSSDFELLYSINIIENEEAFKKMLLLSLIGTLTIFVQEFRDIEGDLKVDRKTFPIRFGTSFSRYICCITCIISIFIINYVFMYNYIYLISNTFLLLIISIRVISKTQKYDDKITYDIWCIWYCINYLFIY